MTPITSRAHVGRQQRAPLLGAHGGDSARGVIVRECRVGKDDGFENTRLTLGVEGDETDTLLGSGSIDVVR